MENIKITKDNLDKFIKDFQNFAKTENPFLQTNLPKFLKRIFSLYFYVYLAVPLFISINIITKPIMIHRDFIPKNIKKVKIPPELTVDFLDTKEIHNKYEETLQKEIDKFLEILEKNFKLEDLAIFWRNIQSLDIKEVKTIIENTVGTKILGYYNARNNKITILKDFKSNTIIHELFHMATSYRNKKNGISYCGFHQKGKGLNLGNGINEGYTQLLANRYSNTTDSNCYIDETKYAKTLEDIIGKDLMQSLYLQTNLKDLIIELTKYQTEAKIMQFIQNMDLWLKYKNDLNLTQKMNNCRKNIETFLIETYIEKIKIELKETIFNDEDTFENFLQKHCEYLYNIRTFPILLSVDEIDSIFEKYLGNTIKEKKEQIQKYKWEQIELSVKQEQEEWEQKFNNIHFSSEPPKVVQVEIIYFGELPDDDIPKR